MYVNQHFDDFIASGSFTQKNLGAFETRLHGKLQEYMKKEGIEEQLGPRKAADDVFANRSQSSRFDRILHADANPADDLAIAQSRNTAHAQNKDSQLRALHQDIGKNKRSRRDLNLDKQLNVNLSLPQIAINRGGTLTRNESTAKGRPPVGAKARLTLEHDRTRGSVDPHRLQNFRSSAHIQQDKSYFNEAQAGRKAHVKP